MLRLQFSLLLFGLFLSSTSITAFTQSPLVESFVISHRRTCKQRQRRPPFFVRSSPDSNKNEQPVSTAAASSPPPPPPMFNGKRILPGSIVSAGLKAANGKRVPAVYALYPKSKTPDGVAHVGVTQDLWATLQCWQQQQPQQPLAGVRALSFTTFPQATVMQQIADEWKQEALAAGAQFVDWVDVSSFLYDDEDDDDEDEWDEEDQETVLTVSNKKEADEQQEQDNVIVSPFDSASTPVSSSSSSAASAEFTVESVDRVLDEVRPYLVADGGNVAVVGVNVAKWSVQLELQGACGSCPSSTVTMQMGIERVLKEQFGSQVVVEQVSSTVVPDEPLEQLVTEELQRLSQAVIAMGGVVRLVNVDPTTGVVQLQFRGANKLKSGLELAIRDVPGVNAVQFVSLVEDSAADAEKSNAGSKQQDSA